MQYHFSFWFVLIVLNLWFTILLILVIVHVFLCCIRFHYCFQLFLSLKWERQMVTIFWTFNVSCWKKNSLFVNKSWKIFEKKNYPIKKCMGYILYCCLIYFIDYIVSALLLLKTSTLLIPCIFLNLLLIQL